jgi:hypothetical protein
MPMRLHATQIAAIVEQPEGQKGTITNVDAFPAKAGLTFSPAIEMYARDLLRGSLSQFPSVSGKRSSKIGFDVELVGSGAAGTAPFWGKLMRACGYSESVIPATSVTYKPTTDYSILGTEKVTNGGFDEDSGWVKGANWTISGGIASKSAGGLNNLSQDTSEVADEIYKVVYTINSISGGSLTVSIGGTNGAARSTPGTFTEYIKAAGTGDLTFTPSHADVICEIDNVSVKKVSGDIPSLTLSVFMDGVIKSIWGAKGNVRIEMNSGQPGILHFEFTGADFDVVTGNLLTGIDYPTIIPPAFLNAGLLLNLYAAICSKVDIDTANAIALREDISSLSGYLSALITGRNPKGSIDPELTYIETHDFYGLWRTPGTLGALSLSANGGAGNIVTITCPKIRYAAIAPGDRNGIRTLALDFEPTAGSDAGDDEISICLT